MPMTSLESPSTSPRVHATPLKGGEPIGRGVRILAAVLGSLLFVVAAAGGMMVVWALAEGRWNDAREHAGSVPALLCGLLLLSSARSGRDVRLERIRSMMGGTRRFH
ncbi:MAG TPA: hypothetical protein VLK84_29095 [Longimicrobium sp.]|nr:hypothetical protein [Longimicrobium sp.]